MIELPVALYDAFTDEPYRGNVAGVVQLEGSLSEVCLREIAAELNAPTTGFVRHLSSSELEIRFFTPIQEIPLCGHVIVGAISASVDQKRILTDGEGRASVSVQTNAGEILVTINRETDARPQVFMRQHRSMFREVDTCCEESIALALGVPSDTFESALPLAIGSTGLSHLFVPMRGLSGIAAVRADASRLIEVSRCLEVDTIAPFTLETAGTGSQVHCRDFVAACGGLEESGSGTTNCALSCYLIKNGIVATNGQSPSVTIVAEQGFEMGRPSKIESKIYCHDHKVVEAWVGGIAVCSLTGALTVEACYDL